MGKGKTPANQKQILILANRIKSMEGMLGHLDAQGYERKLTIEDISSKLERMEQNLAQLLDLLIPKEESKTDSEEE